MIGTTRKIDDVVDDVDDVDDQNEIIAHRRANSSDPQKMLTNIPEGLVFISVVRDSFFL